MSITKTELIAFLKGDVAPALGCTEPVCVALCAATAASHMTGKPERIQVTVNPNIYKNGMSAGIPNFHKIGLEYAAALGAFLQNPQKKLRSLQVPIIPRESALQPPWLLPGKEQRWCWSTSGFAVTLTQPRLTGMV